MNRLDLMKKLTFGSQVAEEEVTSLQEYFVQTDQWSRILSGNIDIVRGEKGAGKSAIYLLLNKNEDTLFDQRILIVSGENPRGITVFKDLISDPPTSETEFVILWKLYFLTIICFRMREMGIKNKEITPIYALLCEANLLENESNKKQNLQSLLGAVQRLARQLLNSSSYEFGLQFDPNSGAPTGIVAKVSLKEPSTNHRDLGVRSIDGMLETTNDALVQADYSIWVLMDRLDVAFAETHALETNALRALIRVYTDLRAFEKINLKIFLREDIWKRITETGLREASHLTRYEVMRWTTPMLLNLTLRRILNNNSLCEELKINKDEVLGSAEKQEAIFDRIFPKQVDQGSRKAATFDWMVGRCADGTGKTAPRELIHLLNCIRDEEIRRLERGEQPAPAEQLFDRSVFKAALPTVSENRLNTYLYAEFPLERPYIEMLKNEKAEQTLESLSQIWNADRETASKKVESLVQIGFFQQKGTRQEPTYWVPFLYRDALSLVQGRAGGPHQNDGEGEDE